MVERDVVGRIVAGDHVGWNITVFRDLGGYRILIWDPVDSMNGFDDWAEGDPQLEATFRSRRWAV
jgi:hypothetical protein